MNKDNIIAIIKGIPTFLFTEHEKLKMKPIFLVVGVIAIIAALYFLVLKGDGSESKPKIDTEVEETMQPSEEESNPKEKSSLSDKVTNFLKPSEDVTNKYANLVIPTISDQDLEIDPSLVKEEENEEKPVLQEEKVEKVEDFKVNKIDSSNSGRRDPMKQIVGSNTGTYDEKRYSNLPADLKNETHNYFTGIAVEDIILDYVSIDELGDNKRRADFIINGSYIPNLEEGDYLLELYYISKINIDKKTVTLQFGDKAYVLGAKDIYHSKSKINNNTEGKTSSSNIDSK